MKKRTFKEFKQGFYKPVNKSKCLNKTLPEYRSSLEMKFMRVLDTNENVVKWSSEMVIIPYFKESEQRWARYFVDFFFEIKTDKGNKKYLIEIKPEKECSPPVIKNNSKKKPATILYEKVTWLNNKNKWDAAKKWCEQKGDIEFLIVNEGNIDAILGK